MIPLRPYPGRSDEGTVDDGGEDMNWHAVRHEQAGTGVPLNVPSAAARALTGLARINSSGVTGMGEAADTM